MFLGIKNITVDGRLDLTQVRRISEDDFPRWTSRVLPEFGDIVFSYEATLNRYAVIPRGFRGCLGRRLALIRPDTRKIDVWFLFYYFFGKEWRDTVADRTNIGSTVDRIPLADFPEFSIALPPLPTQRKIAAVLSAYDGLLETNLRRISILEETAQSLYREWFVDLRFPGHETVRLADSELGAIPEGWDITPFTEIADVLSGGTPTTRVDEYWNGAIPFFTPKDAPSSFYVTETEKTITELGLSKCSSQLYAKDTVFITARGTVGRVVAPGRTMAMNQSCYALRGRDGVSQLYLFLATRDRVDYLRANTGGATFDTIVVDTFRRMRVVRPPLAIIGRFSEDGSPKKWSPSSVSSWCS